MSALLVAVLLVSCAAFPDPDAHPPARRELFAAEPWYKGMEGKEQTFIGTLSRVDRGKDVVGFGRFNPYRLKLADGQVREVHVGGRPELLAPYAGRRVRLIGKAVDMEVEGRQHHEIWPARVELLPPSQEGKKGGG